MKRTGLHSELKLYTHRTSPVAQWLRLCTPSAGGQGLIPGQGTRSCVLQLKILHASKKMEGPECCNLGLV